MRFLNDLKIPNINFTFKNIYVHVQRHTLLFWGKRYILPIMCMYMEDDFKIQLNKSLKEKKTEFLRKVDNYTLLLWEPVVPALSLFVRIQSSVVHILRAHVYNNNLHLGTSILQGKILLVMQMVWWISRHEWSSLANCERLRVTASKRHDAKINSTLWIRWGWRNMIKAMNRIDCDCEEEHGKRFLRARI